MADQFLNVTGSGVQDGQQPSVTSTPVGAKQALDVNLAGSSGGGVTATVVQPDGSLLHVTVDASALPAGAATAANQATANASLSSIDSKTPTLGQKTMSGSSPVVIASDQSPVPVSGTVAVSNFPSTQPISGTVTANQGSAAAIAGAWPAKVTDGTNVAAVTAASALKVDGSAVTQPVSAASLPLPAGAATAANQATANASLSSIDSKLTSPLLVAQSGTWTTGRTWTLASGTDSVSAAVSNFPASQSVTQGTSPWVVSGTVTANAGTGTFQTNVTNSSLAVTQSGTWTVQPGNTPNTAPWLVTVSQGGNSATVTAAGAVKVDGSAVTQPVSAVSLPLPTGAATETTLSALNTKVTTTANGIKVDGSAVTQPVSAASLPLPIGAATSALQTTGNSSLSSIDSKLFSTGSATKVDGSAVTQPVSAASLPLPIGAATAANQATANASLSSIDSKLTAPLSTTETQKAAGYSRYGDVATAAVTMVPVRRTNDVPVLTVDTAAFISSSSANDALAGTGAQKVRVTYYLQNGSGPFTVDASMNGTSIVSVATLSFVERMEVVQVGSGGTSAGSIVISTFSPLTNICTMNTGDSETFFAEHFVPLGKTSYVTGITMSHTGTAAGNGAVFTLKKQTIPLAAHPLISVVGTFHLQGTNGTQDITFLTPVPIVGPAYVVMYVTPDAVAANTYFSSINLYDV